jgi:hypothetical protein
MPATIAITVEDGKNPPNKSTVFVNIPTATTVAAATTFAQGITGLIDAVIGGKITNLAICYRVTLPGGLKALAEALSDVEEGAKFIWRTAGNFLTSFRLPTFLESKILAGTKSVDLTDPDVDGVVDFMTTGSLGVTPTDARDDDIETVASARENFVKDRG